MQVVIMGATGLVGGWVIQELLAEPRCSLITSVGRRSQAPQVNKWTERVGPMTDLEALLGDVKADAAFCCLGTTIKKAGSQGAFEEVDFHLPLLFAKAAQERGVKQFHVVSSLGADARSKNFYLRTKGRMEEGLRSLGFQTLVIYRPSLLLGERQEKRSMEQLSIQAWRWLEPVYPRFLASWKPIDARHVAQAMVAEALQEQKGTRVLENKDLHQRRL